MSSAKFMVSSIFTALALSIAADRFCAAEPTSDPPTLEQRFRELPLEARRLTGPLFWLHGDESPEKLERYLEKVAEGGNGCFTAESRPHVDWLGPGWYRDLQVCLDAAKRHNLKMWIFDEKWWPSGEVGGMVPQKYASKYMEAKPLAVEGPKDVRVDIDDEAQLIAILAGKLSGDGVDGDSLIDLTATVQDGAVRWSVSEGRWQVMIFTWRFDEGRRGKFLVDGASQDAVDWYIKTVYQPHYDHFPDDFGKTIQGYFYDEPETFGDWGTEVIPELKRRGADWKRALVAWKFQLADADEQVAAKYQYQDAFAETWGKTLYGGITEWCHKHNVRSIGHWLEHKREYLDRRKCAGNMFQVQKYSDMGGIDAVYKQFVPGRKDDHTYQTPKLGSSISHAYGKQDDLAMVEIFGARGQDLTYREMKWWTDHMHVSGINFHIPHAFNPRSPYDRDCPPYFFNSGFEPRWPLYRVYADYTSRLSVMLSGGRHVCPVAFLYLGNSFHVGKAITPEDMTTALQDALFDCDWIPYEVFEDDMSIEPGGRPRLKLRDERYQVLIVPAVEVIPYETLVKAKAFYEAGGVVVGYGMLPSKSASPGKTSAEIIALRTAIWGEAPTPGSDCCRANGDNAGRSYFLPAKPTSQNIQEVLTGHASIHPTLEVLEGETDDWLHVLHRVKDGRDVFFISNNQYDGPTKSFRFQTRATKGVPEVWDPLRGEIRSIAFSETAFGGVVFALTLEPQESVLVVFNSDRRTLPLRIGSEQEPVALLNVERLPNSAANRAPAVKQAKRITLPPVKEADPFRGQVTVPQAWLDGGKRVYVETKDIPHEDAAVVTVNGKYAGGFIGKPFRLDVTRHLQVGTNTVELAPFAPAAVRFVVYPSAAE